MYELQIFLQRNRRILSRVALAGAISVASLMAVLPRVEAQAGVAEVLPLPAFVFAEEPLTVVPVGAFPS